MAPSDRLREYQIDQLRGYIQRLETGKSGVGALIDLVLHLREAVTGESLEKVKQLISATVQETEGMAQKIARLERERKDLDNLLESSIEHYDEVERELLQRVHDSLESNKQQLEVLNQTIQKLTEEKTDLEILFEASTGHSDIVETELLAKVESTILESDNRLKLITEAIPIPILVSRAGDSFIIYANLHAAKLFGVDVSSLVTHHTMAEFVSLEDRAKVGTLLQLGSVDSLEVQGMKANQSLFWAELTVQPFTFNNEPCLLSIWHDITGRVHMEEQLRQACKMEAIGTFASGIAHDFNNILSAIFGFSELALMDLDEDHIVRESVQKIVASARRAKSLVRMILTFARQSEEEIKPLRVASVLKEAMQLIQQIATSNISVEVEIKRKDAVIIGDATQLHQVIMNLCSNAIDAMREKGGVLRVMMDEVTPDDMQGYLLTFTATLEPKYVMIRVSDTGIGIPKKIMDAIFDPFFTTKPPGKGTGMGLSVLHGIVGRHHGAIKVTSAPGKGSEFSIYFPAASGGESILEKEEIEPMEIRPFGAGRLLVVDDETDLLDIYRDVLGGYGYTINTQTNGQSALEIFQEQADRFDAVITDERMPIMGGLTLSSLLKAIRPGIPVILCTGSGITSIPKDYASSIDYVLTKPFTIRDLSIVVRKALERNKA